VIYWEVTCDNSYSIVRVLVVVLMVSSAGNISVLFVDSFADIISYSASGSFWRCRCGVQFTEKVMSKTLS